MFLGGEPNKKNPSIDHTYLISIKVLPYTTHKPINNIKGRVSTRHIAHNSKIPKLNLRFNISLRNLSNSSNSWCTIRGQQSDIIRIHNRIQNRGVNNQIRRVT